MKLKQGFTLIEVVVVIGIIGILTVIIFPAVSNVRAKNRDTERVADIAAIQLGLSLFYNQNNSYPTTTIDGFEALVPKYFPGDSLIPPTDDPQFQYTYIPLARGTGSTKCTYYHLGTKLELPSGQIDLADKFSSLKDGISNNYSYCQNGVNNIYSGPGLMNSTTTYAVHP